MQVTNGPGNPSDWVALAERSAPNALYATWQYLNGSTVPPAQGASGATLTFVMPPSPGTYELHFFANNGFNRLATSTSIVSSTTPPTVAVTLTHPFPGTTFAAPSSLTLDASATVTNGTITRVEFFAGPTLIGTATTAPYQATWTAPPVGAHVLTAVATDHTGAVTTSAPVTIAISQAGGGFGTLGAPVASPPGGVYAMGQQVTLTAAPGTTIHYTTDDSAPDATSAVYSGPLTVAQSLTLRARAFQTGWTESAATRDTYVIDTAPPTITATISPAPNAAGWNNTPVTVSFECLDAGSVTNCPTPMPVMQDGAGQLVTVSAVDAFGLQASLTVTVNIDTVAPVVSLTAPTADLSTTDATLAVLGVVDDTGSGIALAQCGGQVAGLSGSNASCTVALAAGQNTVVLTALDRAGNSSSAGVRATV